MDLRHRALERNDESQNLYDALVLAIFKSYTTTCMGSLILIVGLPTKYQR